MLAALAALVLLPGMHLGAGSRQDAGGWIILHLSGKPIDIGRQHGALAAAEIEDAMRAEAALIAVQHPEIDWKWLRDTAERVCWNKVDPEYQEEIKGIAEGMRSTGSQRDWKDVLALNAHIELLDYYLPVEQAGKGNQAVVSHAPLACSAFVATGSATADGRPVMGHNFWWDYFTGLRWREVLDITPEKGHRVILDTLPGMIHSGSDWSVNDAGILLCETTISGASGFDVKGIPEFVRMRKAAQYATSLTQAYDSFVTGNNGGYANTWLMADTKTNEIGKLELGLKNVIFHRSSDGTYVGSNFAENPKLIAEDAKGYVVSPNNNCEMRKARWKERLDADYGKITAVQGKAYVSDAYDELTKDHDGGGSALCGKSPGGGACSATVCTAAMAEKMQYWARAGVPDGSRAALGYFAGLPATRDLLPNPSPHDWLVIGGQ